MIRKNNLIKMYIFSVLILIMIIGSSFLVFGGNGVTAANTLVCCVPNDGNKDCEPKTASNCPTGSNQRFQMPCESVFVNGASLCKKGCCIGTDSCKDNVRSVTCSSTTNWRSEQSCYLIQECDKGCCKAKDPSVIVCNNKIRTNCPLDTNNIPNDADDKVFVVGDTCEMGCYEDHQICKDDDPADDLWVKGTAKNNAGTTLSDTCDGNDVKQVKCENGVPVLQDPSTICPAYHPCSDGKCKPCYDSDSGDNKFIAGHVQMKDQTEESQFIRDECTSMNLITAAGVKEVYCINNYDSYTVEARLCSSLFSSNKCKAGFNTPDAYCIPSSSGPAPAPSATSNSLWFIKNTSELRSLSGIAYEFLPHELVFNFPVTKEFKINGQISYDYWWTRFDDSSIISRCVNTVLETTNSMVYPEQDTTIETNDVRYVIPAGAVSMPTQIMINKLSVDCNDDLARILDKIKSTSNSQNFKIVIGKTASTEDNIAAVDIAGAFKIQNTIDDNATADLNDYLIVIGGPAANRKAADMMGLSFPASGDESGIPADQGLIAVYNNFGKVQILVAGYETLQTRMAARALVRYGEFESLMAGSVALVNGTSLNNIYVLEPQP